MVKCNATTETFHKPPQPTSIANSQFETKNEYICTVGRTLENAEAQLEIEGLGAVVDCAHLDARPTRLFRAVQPTAPTSCECHYQRLEPGQSNQCAGERGSRCADECQALNADTNNELTCTAPQTRIFGVGKAHERSHRREPMKLVLHGVESKG